MRNEFTDRLLECGLSRWELGDLLGLHPHALRLADHRVAMNGQPVRVVAELAARLDLHPADLADALDPVLTNRRAPEAGDRADADACSRSQLDAQSVLSALARTGVPMSVDDLATGLVWTLARTSTAIEYARQHPALTGPLALRRHPPHRWVLSIRLDTLTAVQRRNLDQSAPHPPTLNPTEAIVLLAAYRGQALAPSLPGRPGGDEAEQSLRAAGLLHGDLATGTAELHPDVRYSLDRS